MDTLRTKDKSSGPTIVTKKLQKRLVFEFIVFTFLFVLALNNKIVVVHGESMQPTIQDGSVGIACSVSEVCPGRVYALVDPENDYVIKRLVGVPGDTIVAIDGAVYRNGSLMMEAPEGSFDNYIITLGADEYFFLGDNRTESYDSRYWSRLTSRKEILFELQFIFFPSLKVY